MSREILYRYCCTAPVVALASLFASGSAHAGLIPAVEISIQASDGTDTTFNPAGAPAAGGTFNYQGSDVFTGFTLGWDFSADPTPGGASPNAFIGNNINLMNTSSEAITFAIEITLPLDSGGAGLDYLGSVGFTLSGIDGLLESLPDSSLWTAMADGAEVDSLFDYDSFLGFTGPGSQSASAGLPMGTTDAFDTIGVLFNFVLSPGDTVTTTGAFSVVPGPSVLALLGVGLLIGRRRRRV